jgi:aminomethyltransferase
MGSKNVTDKAKHKTIFYARHVELEAKIIEFANWLMPLSYKTGIINEHLLTRKKAGLFDVSHMGRFIIKGRNVLKFLQNILTNNSQALRELESQYTIIPDKDGFAIDDAYLYRFFKDEYLLVVNAGNRIKDFEYLKFHADRFDDIEIIDKTFEMAMIGLQGPLSKEILQKVIGKEYLPEPIRNNLSIAKIDNPQVLISRTGYTGESLCFELFINKKDALPVWDILVENGAFPVGLGARDTLRLEACLPLYGQELGIDPEGQNIPIFASLQSQIAVSFSPLKDDFTGRDSLLKQFHALEKINNKDFSLINNLPKKIMPFVLQDKGIARHGDKVYFNEKYIGYVTSGTAIPYWKTVGEGLNTKLTDEMSIRSIGLAYIDSHIWEEDVVDIDVRGKKLKAVIMPYHLRSEAPPFSYPIIYGKEEKPSFLLSQEKEGGLKGSTYKNVQLLLENTYKNTVWRQTECINLIPSEQTPSRMVRILSIMDPAGRYAEHKKIKAFYDSEIFYYQGTGFIAQVEQLLKKELVTYLGCREVETRPLSGQMANSIVFSALVDHLNRAYKKGEPKRLGYILNHHIIKGGHLSAQPMGALKDFVFIDPETDKPAVIDFPVLKDNPYKIDMVSCAKIIEEYKPGLIILGRSAMLNKEPVCQIRSILNEMDIDSIILYDMAHILGLAGPYFQEPFKEGADIVTGSTHKTFFGTQRGLIATNYQKPQPGYDLWEAIERRTFPGSVSNHHPGTLLGLLMAAYEMNFFKEKYQQKVVSNAKSFACALNDLGLDVAGDPDISFTETHQVIINVGYARGPEAARLLEENNIMVNYQASPQDEGFTASGCIRMGVNEMTRFGMGKKDFLKLAQLVFEVIVNKKNVKEDIRKFRKDFLDMKYCFADKDFENIMGKLVNLI